MASFNRIGRQKERMTSAEQVECCNDLITNILSRVSTTDVIKMSRVSKRWQTLIFDPDFVYTHCKNCHRESILCFMDRWTIFNGNNRLMPKQYEFRRLMPNQYEFRSFNAQPGNLSIVPFSCEGLDISFQNGEFNLITASNGLLCLYPRHPLNPLLWVYNPVKKVSKKLSMPFEVDISWMYFAEICCVQNTLKFVMAGFLVSQKRRYTLVFDSHSNSWYEGPPPLIDLYDYSPRRAHCGGTHLFFNGVIYFVAGVKNIDDQELKEIRDVEALSRDLLGRLHMIKGYDVKEDQWTFSIFIPSIVGSIHCLTEWEGNLLVCASGSDGVFVFWILDTEHKLWIRERDLDLSHRVRTFWKVSAGGSVVWFRLGYNSVKVYHMKNRHWSTYRLNDAFAPQKKIPLSLATFEPTLLSF